MNLFPAPNIHRLFIKFDQKFPRWSTLSNISPHPFPYKKVLWIIIVIVHENIGTKTGDLEQTF